MARCDVCSRYLRGALAHVTLCDRCYRRCTRDARWWIQRPIA